MFKTDDTQPLNKWEVNELNVIQIESTLGSKSWKGRQKDLCWVKLQYPKRLYKVKLDVVFKRVPGDVETQ